MSDFKLCPCLFGLANFGEPGSFPLRSKVTTPACQLESSGSILSANAGGMLVASHKMYLL